MTFMDVVALEAPCCEFSTMPPTHDNGGANVDLAGYAPLDKRAATFDDVDGVPRTTLALVSDGVTKALAELAMYARNRPKTTLPTTAMATKPQLSAAGTRLSNTTSSLQYNTSLEEMEE